jgi:hypothetical protein
LLIKQQQKYVVIIWLIYYNSEVICCSLLCLNIQSGHGPRAVLLLKDKGEHVLKINLQKYWENAQKRFIIVISPNFSLTMHSKLSITLLYNWEVLKKIYHYYYIIIKKRNVLHTFHLPSSSPSCLEQYYPLSSLIQVSLKYMLVEFDILWYIFHPPIQLLAWKNPTNVHGVNMNPLHLYWDSLRFLHATSRLMLPVNPFPHICQIIGSIQ